MEIRILLHGDSEERQKQLDSKVNLTGGYHFSNLRHCYVCGDSFHALQCPGVFGGGNENL